MAELALPSVGLGTTRFLKKLLINPRAAISVLVVMAMALLVVPLPTILIDVMVSANLLLAIYLLLKTIYVKDSLQLTTFPSLLLLTTVFRLAVSIATARAILSTGEAGELIRTFGEFVVGGQLVVGLVIFAVISIVQFMVITKGGERIAEVSARFTLDALPGKQMSIDADLKAGDITREEARARRKRLQAESEFFGSMDGAMRFVKGDCLATMLIVAVNLIGGIILGTVVQGMSVDLAVKTFSILSIGDGLVAQIPSILSSLAAGILSTRVNGEEASEEGLGGDIAAQLLGENKSLLAAAATIGCLGLVPGFPGFTLIPLATLIMAAILIPSWRRKRKATAAKDSSTTSADAAAPYAAAALPLPIARFNDPLRVSGNPTVIDALERGQLGNRLQDVIKVLASEAGCSIHTMKFARVTSMPADRLDVSVEGIVTTRIQVGENPDVASLSDRLAGISRTFSAEAFGIDDTEEWLDTQGQNFPKLIESIQAQLPKTVLSGVLRNLLREGLSISHPRAMLEELLVASETKFTVSELSDVARAVLVRQVISQHSDDNGRVELVELDDQSLSALERLLEVEHIDAIDDFNANEKSKSQFVARLIAEMERLSKSHSRLLLVVPSGLRAELATNLRDHGSTFAVISVSEADRIARPALIGKINLGFSEWMIDE